MRGTTHTVCGAAAALLFVAPKTIPSALLTLGTAVAAAALPDIDVGSSRSHREAVRSLLLGSLTAAAAYYYDTRFDLRLFERMQSSHALLHALGALSPVVLICLIGLRSPHRSFMHSLVVCVALTACAYALLPALAPAFAAAYASHILLDLLNRKGVRVFWPLKKRVCLKLCDSGGWVDGIFLIAGLALCVYSLAQIAVRTGLMM